MAMTILHLHLPERIETGALQIGDDWPGLFIRGDRCLQLLSLLREVQTGSYDSFYLSQIKELADLIENNVVQPHPTRDD